MEILCRYILYFAFYSFFGWAIETIFCTVKTKKFENRGFLNGPFCPIYAAGALLTVLTLERLPRSVPMIFLSGLLLTSLLEYLTGWLLEVLFKTRWWDYSDQKFNLQGRICLFNSVCFGVLSVGLIFVIHPGVVSQVGRIPTVPAEAAALFFTVYFITDFTVTVCSVMGLNRRLKVIHTSTQMIKEKLDALGFYTTSGIRERVEKFFESVQPDSNLIYDSIKSLSERIGRLELDNRIFQKRILKAFPNIRSLRYPEILNNIKETLAGKIIPKSPDSPEHQREPAVKR